MNKCVQFVNVSGLKTRGKLKTENMKITIEDKQDGLKAIIEDGSVVTAEDTATLCRYAMLAIGLHPESVAEAFNDPEHS